jgi:hypothetical protein
MTMHYTVERLLRGDRMIVAHFQAAAARWVEILSTPESQETESLAKLLQSQQMWFERNCGGRWPGQEVMVLAGFGSLYSTEAGFENNRHRAAMLTQAFAVSACSFEVKSIAQSVARQYDLPGDE